MELQSIVDSINAIAAIFAFDILPDGSFGEIRFMRVNKIYATILGGVNPNVPEFVPDTPYKVYFQDVNFEKFVYRCVSKNEILYSCANAHGAWIQGMYLPMSFKEEHTAYCCYVCKYAQEPDPDSVGNHSLEVSSAVLNISADLHRAQDFTQSMVQTAKNLREICGAKYCSVFLVDTEEKSCSLITERGADPAYLNEMSESMGRTPYEMAMAWEKDLAESDCLILDDLSIIKERDEQWYESLRAFEIDSLVFYAVRYQQKLVGFIWAVNFDAENMMRIKETVELTTFFIGAVIANHQLLGKLEFMSMIDRLTGVRNRNAFDRRVVELTNSEVVQPESVGVIYADLNGLKTINDKEGHEAGDRLLKKAASLLRLVFEEYEIYRVGGDEFVIVCPDISEEIMERKMAELRRITEDTEDVRFAVGTGIFTGQYDFDQTVKIVDERMYEDKKAFYRSHPELDRRK